MVDPAIEEIDRRIRELAAAIGAPETLLPWLSMLPASVGGTWISRGRRGGAFSLLFVERGGTFTIASEKDADVFVAKVLGFITREMAGHAHGEQERLMAMLDPVWTERLNRPAPARFEKDRLVVK
ncbi:MAG: hypothetical protein ACOYM5_17275 [Caulobacter sp.]